VQVQRRLLGAAGHKGHAMQDNRHRLAVRIFRIIEGEAEGPLAILAFFILALAAIAMTLWFRS
jgi:hypothetical protein